MGENRFSYPMFRDLRDNAAGFEVDCGAVLDAALPHVQLAQRAHPGGAGVAGRGSRRSGSGIALGRPLGPDDDRVPGGHSVCVLTYDFWRSRFGGDRAIVNKVLLLNGHPMVVVGVAARGYRGFDVGERTDVLVPTMMKAAMTPAWNGLEDRRVPVAADWWAGCAPGVPAATAQARLRPFYNALLRIEAESIELPVARG